MEEQRRTVRAVSYDTERPYYTINYALPFAGREMLADALEADNNAEEAMCVDSTGAVDDDRFRHVPGQEFGRVQRSRSAAAPNELGVAANELEELESDMPGTPRTQNRRSCKAGFDPFNRKVQRQQATNGTDSSNDVHASRYTRSRSVATAAELEVNRSAPPLSRDALLGYGNNNNNNNNDGSQGPVPLLSVQHGLVTCLNSKNVGKYRIGQSYKRGTIIGIDEELGKIVVFHKDMPPGALTVLKSNDASRYEKGFSITDSQGNELGMVHAVDRRQNMLVLNRPTLVAQNQQQQHTNSRPPFIPTSTPSPPAAAIVRVGFEHDVKSDNSNINNINNGNKNRLMGKQNDNNKKLFISVGGNAEETKTSSSGTPTAIPSPISMGHVSGVVF